MNCQDCGNYLGTNLIFDKEKDDFFLVCRECLKSTDKICDENLIKEWCKK